MCRLRTIRSYQRCYEIVLDASLLSAKYIRIGLASLSSQTSLKTRWFLGVGTGFKESDRTGSLC